jgi:hypothetical protein
MVLTVGYKAGERSEQTTLWGMIKIASKNNHLRVETF